MEIGQHQGDFLAGTLAAVAAGILAGQWMAVPVWMWAACFALLLAAAALLAWRQHRMAWMAVLGLCFVTGALRFAMAYALPGNDISRPAGNAATVGGIITEEPRTVECADGTIKLRYAVEVHEVKDGNGKRSATGGMYIYARAKARVPEARIGDGIEASGTIRLPRGYGNPGQIDTVMLLRCQGITAQMTTGKQGASLRPMENKRFLRQMAEIRKSYRERMETVMPKSDAAALFAMLFGGYEGLKPELVEAFTATGIVHILSVSGSHVSLVAAVMAWLGTFLRLPKPAQCMLVLGVIAVYCVLAGCVPPVIRSGIMGGLAFLALALERENDARRILLLTGLGMLLCSPLLLFHISFQLSFSATSGLLYVAPSLRRWMEERQLPKFVAGSLAITVAAQVFTIPIIAWYFNQLSLSSLLANLLPRWNLYAETARGGVDMTKGLLTKTKWSFLC